MYITEQLNLTVKTTESTIPSEGGSQHVNCDYLLFLKHSDICSMKYHQVLTGNNFGMPIATEWVAATLLAGVPKGTAPNTWVYIEVFGLPQWLIFFSLLFVLAIVGSVMQTILGHHRQGVHIGPAYEGFIMAALFSIQQGSHPGNRDLTSKRVLALTTSIITLLAWVYYSNDITSKMTAGSPPIPVRSFDDVLDQGYKVIVIGELHFNILKNSKNGTAISVQTVF